MIKFFKNVQRWYRSLRYFIIVDPADNSVTLSKKLFKHIQSNSEFTEKACVFVFRIKGTHLFGFMINPNVEQPTQICDIQYNGKHKCIGFETLNPSVGRILYDYRLPAEKKCKLSVTIHKVCNKTLYQIESPHI